MSISPSSSLSPLPPMSLYAHNFTFLARPQRSTLSFGDEATRATLPDFADVAQLASFVKRLHVWRFDVHGTWAQFKFGALFVTVLLVVVIAIILRRMYDRTFWLVRIVKKPTGRVIVPNAMLAFSVIEGVYAMAIIAFLWLYSRWFESGRGESPPVNPLLWLALPCCPLITGVIWAIWGTHFATPSSSQLRFGLRRHPGVQDFFGHAAVINTLFLLCPAAVIVTVLVPGIVSNTGYMIGLHMGQQWQAQYADQADFSEAMVQDAQRVWFQAIASMRPASAMFICWAVYATTVATAYSIVSLRLLSTIRTELEKYDDAPMYGVHSVTTDEEKFHSGSETIDATATTDDTSQTHVNRTDSDGSVKARKVCSNSNATLPLRASPPTDSSPTGWRRFMPNLVMHTATHQKRIQSLNSRQKQITELRKAAMHICIQFLAITPACVAMAALKMLLSVTTYGLSEQPSANGGTRFEHTLNIEILLIVWCVCPAGMVTLLAIAQRAYEPVFASMASSIHSSSIGRRTPSTADQSKSTFFETHTTFFETHTVVDRA